MTVFIHSVFCNQFKHMDRFLRFWSVILGNGGSFCGPNTSQVWKVLELSSSCCSSFRAAQSRLLCRLSHNHWQNHRCCWDDSEKLQGTRSPAAGSAAHLSSVTSVHFGPRGGWLCGYKRSKGAPCLKATITPAPCSISQYNLRKSAVIYQSDWSHSRMI